MNVFTINGRTGKFWVRSLDDCTVSMLISRIWQLHCCYVRKKKEWMSLERKLYIEEWREVRVKGVAVGGEPLAQ